MILARHQLFTRRKPSIRATRLFVAQTLTEWGHTDRLGDIRLCVSEIATNALLHGVPPGRFFAVHITADQEQVRIEVRDSGPGHPIVRTPRAGDEHGRGLLLVGELSDAWGNIDHAVGKTVWFTVKSTPVGGHEKPADTN